MGGRRRQLPRQVADEGVPSRRPECHALGVSASTPRMTRAAFAAVWGFPFVAKPPAGAGARNTFRVDRAEQMEQWLASSAPHPGDPALLEEFIIGDEHSFDSVVIHGRLVWHSISRYLPTPLDVLENPWIQWCVLLPREIDGPEYDRHPPASASTPLTCARACRRASATWSGSVAPTARVAISEVGARPPGAQFTTLMSLRPRRRPVSPRGRTSLFTTVSSRRSDARRWAPPTCAPRAKGAPSSPRTGSTRSAWRSRELIVDARLPDARRPADRHVRGRRLRHRPRRRDGRGRACPRRDRWQDPVGVWVMCIE